MIVDVGPETVTTDPAAFQKGLDAMSVNGGGDCPELALGGIKMAMENSAPQSQICWYLM